MTRRHVLLWREEGSFGADYAEATLDGTRLTATGTHVGSHPMPYVMEYALTTSDAYVTRQLSVATRGAGWSRSIVLERGESGDWTYDATAAGEVDLPPVEGDTASVAGALDCDLGRCPLTNTMPVLRHGLLHGGGPVEFVMAWISVPDLRLHRSEQVYAHLSRNDGRAVVRYEGRHRGFVGELQFDDDGFVVHYPDLASRVA